MFWKEGCGVNLALYYSFRRKKRYGKRCKVSTISCTGKSDVWICFVFVMLRFIRHLFDVGLHSKIIPGMDGTYLLAKQVFCCRYSPFSMCAILRKLYYLRGVNFHKHCTCGFSWHYISFSERELWLLVCRNNYSHWRTINYWC